ncbi:MAG: hypothetical protein R2709_11870 [Marmoricola sp.]
MNTSIGAVIAPRTFLGGAAIAYLATGTSKSVVGIGIGAKVGRARDRGWKYYGECRRCGRWRDRGWKRGDERDRHDQQVLTIHTQPSTATPVARSLTSAL